jgi:hypothetical protein
MYLSRTRLAGLNCGLLRLIFCRAKTRWLQRDSRPEIVFWPFLLHPGEEVRHTPLVDIVGAVAEADRAVTARLPVE